jgi:hypothetical protein
LQGIPEPGLPPARRILRKALVLVKEAVAITNPLGVANLFSIPITGSVWNQEHVVV